MSILDSIYERKDRLDEILEDLWETRRRDLGKIAALAAIVVGWGFTELPKRFEWAELSIGIPAIVGVYGYVLWKWAFKDEDRALFRKADPSVPEMA